MRFWQSVAFLPTSQILEVAKASEEARFAGVTVSDHIFYPKEFESSYPYSEDGTPPYTPDTSWPEAWATISAMAAVTERIGFTTNIYVAPARDLFTVAKAVSSAAVLSGGRVALGIGAGWCREEFEQTGQDFASRGKRLDEMIDVLRKLWTGEWIAHSGDHFAFDELRINPVPQAPIPVYVGGESNAAMRRAARLGDGWIGTVYVPDDAEDKLDALFEHLDEAGRDRDGFRVFMALMARQTPEVFTRFAQRGVTDFLTAPWMMAGEKTLDARLEAIRRFATVIEECSAAG